MSDVQRETVQAEVVSHVRVREPSNGPDYCGPCSEKEHDYVPWEGHLSNAETVSGQPYWAEFDLRAAGGVSRVLMMRSRNSPGSTWRDIATFGSYNDAEHILRLLRRVEQFGRTRGDQ